MNERELLLRLNAGPVSGDGLARAGGHTRAAAWKRIEALREAGIAIEAQAGRGYSLAQPVELLDAGAIRAQLAGQAVAGLHDPQPARIEVAWSLDSTNAELLRREPTAGVTVLLAERQTGGRGRRGRPWISPLAANLYLSVARRFSGGLARLGGLSLVSGVVAAEALHALGFHEVRLKWPNDLVVGPRKLGGLLVEGGGEHGGPVGAVIGLGLNVRMPPAFAARIGQPWIDLAAMSSRPPSRNTLAPTLLAHLLPALDTFDREGLAPFLARYAPLDALQGREIVVHAGNAEHAGVALGIAADGALRARMPEGERRFHAGDVSVRGR